MGIVVQKFGGTSVATDNARLSLLAHVKREKQNGNNVVLVVSAMGRKGDPYATDTLIGLLESVSTDIDPVKKDLIMSCGEIISCSLISHFLESNGIEAEPMTGFQAGIQTNDDFNNSSILNIDTANILKYIRQNKVPVIAGFQGITRDGRITTLGRGGSDTSAVELGGYLKADVVDIFTDVPGVASVDPRVYPSAQYIERIFYDDMYKLASHGAKVIHPRAVNAAKKFNIPVRVRETYSSGSGTLISGEETRNGRKIVGIALEKQGQDKTSAYVLFNRKHSGSIKEAIRKAIEDKSVRALDASYSEDSASISMLNDYVADNIRIIHNL